MQQTVGVHPAQGQLAFLRRDETILHAVRHPHRRVHADDPRRAFERMGRAHQRFQLGGVPGIAFQRQQSARENGDLILGFEPEEVVHGKLAQVFHG